VGQNDSVVCSAGFGSFYSTSTTGIKVSVAAMSEAGFAKRACEAKLSWDARGLVIEPKAWQVDVDLMGVDLGFGAPVLALQVRQSDVDPLMRYEIYSLTRPPRKLRTITGGNFYSAADTNLDGQIEIWTSDAGAVNGFEGFPLSALDLAPPMALRFENRRLIDVSAEFQPHFDRRIATVRAQIDPRELNSFKSSDGKLSSMSPLSMGEARALRATKIRVLEVVWCYLYSGREQEAWGALADMWPASDLDRIRAAIVAAREHGIRSEVDGASSGAPATRRKKAMIYDRVTETVSDDGPRKIVNLTGGPDDNMRIYEADTYPQPIYFRRPAPPDDAPALPKTEEVVDLVIDSAGKVWSIKVEGKPDPALVDASAEWRFVPALKDGRPVATRLRKGLTPLQ
jgi:hypothetical protein